MWKMINDSISRRAAIRSLETMKDLSGKGDIARFYNKIVDNAIDKLKNLPSEQPEHEYTMEEFMYGQNMGNPEDGSL